MKIGDLVKLNGDAWSARKHNPTRSGRPAEDFQRVGIITEWTAHEDGPLASGWVQWSGNIDWDIEYLEDLELINASR